MRSKDPVIIRWMTPAVPAWRVKEKGFIEERSRKRSVVPGSLFFANVKDFEKFRENTLSGKSSVHPAVFDTSPQQVTR
jgi:hypothetical protein